MKILLLTGYRFQLYAQYFALTEMGYPVERLVLCSLEDNKRYEVDLPVGDALEEFETTLHHMRAFDIREAPLEENLKKCAHCIYQSLCRPDITIQE